MAFFDDLSKKISTAGQGAVQSTKNFANISKINSLIQDEEKKINDVYFQIGKAYFNEKGDAPDFFAASMVQAVKESLAAIEAYNEQIKEIKGVLTCPVCGADVANQSAFCNLCGAKMPDKHPAPVIPENSVQCGSCGAYVAADCKFCTACGSLMTPAEPAPAEAPAAEGKVCPSCGKTLSPGAIFCTGCGTQVG